MIPGDMLLLCSDGLYGAVTEAEIREALGEPAAIEVKAEGLLSRALAAQATDNVSVVLIECAG